MIICGCGKKIGYYDDAYLDYDDNPLRVMYSLVCMDCEEEYELDEEDIENYAEAFGNGEFDDIDLTRKEQAVYNYLEKEGLIGQVLEDESTDSMENES